MRCIMIKIYSIRDVLRHELNKKHYRIRSGLRYASLNFSQVLYRISSNFKLITFSAYNNNFDIRIKVQFFSKF